MSITVHLITHPFRSGPGSECGICHGVSPSAQQLCNRLPPQLRSLSFSLCLFIFPFVVLLGGSAGRHELLARGRQDQSFKAPAVSVGGGYCDTKCEKEFNNDRSKRVRKKKNSEAVKEGNSKPDRVNGFTSTAHIYIWKFSGSTWSIWHHGELCSVMLI